MATMTLAQKRAAVSLAWATYRAESQAIPRTTAWDEYLTADERLWRQYLAAEREILSTPEPKAA